MIIARIESLILDKGMDDALQRAFAYIQAGADGIMIHSRHKDGDEIIDFLKQFRLKDQDTPIVVVPTSFNEIKASDLATYGANIIYMLIICFVLLLLQCKMWQKKFWKMIEVKNLKANV